MNRHILLYVAGPYRDNRGTYYVEQNCREAEAVAVELWRAGFAVLCPHLNTRHLDGVVSGDEFILGDLAMVKRCDAVVVLPGWQDSEGTKREIATAFSYGVPVFFWEARRFWLNHLCNKETGVKP